MGAPFPPDEEFRLEALNALEILDSDPELPFDRIASDAQAAAEARIALISFIDLDRQWFKARIGLDITETPRDVAFCAHAILEDDLLWVSDASCDPRFKNNPLVLGEPHIRFYAGAPIALSGGVRVGTVCVIGDRPRAHDPVVHARLVQLAAEARDALEARRLP